MTQNQVERYGDRMHGVLSCYDRILVTGTLPGACYAQGMTSFLYAVEAREMLEELEKLEKLLRILRPRHLPVHRWRGTRPSMGSAGRRGGGKLGG